MTTLICGARTRKGTFCQRRDLGCGGRCRLHGGLSTGPKTLEGRRKSAQNIGKVYEDLLAAKLDRFKKLNSNVTPRVRARARKPCEA